MQKPETEQSILTHLGTAVPSYALNRQASVAFLERFMRLDGMAQRKLHALNQKTGIETRHSVLPLQDLDNDPKGSFFSPAPRAKDEPATPDRMAVFQREALPLAQQAVRNARIGTDELRQVTHLITVSCTGMAAPGLEFELIEHLKLRTDVRRTNISFMGCYAAITAMASADAICHAYPEARVLVVVAELCTLHFQAEATEDNLLANSLFADGAAAFLMQPNRGHKSGLMVSGFHSEVVPEAQEEMGWKIGQNGFQMRLTGAVPAHLADRLPDFVAKVARYNDGIRPQVVMHPGGKRILNQATRALGLTEDEVAPSLSVLRDFGNMSSATILFVLAHMLRQRTGAQGPASSWLAMAFGPGLCIESCLLTPRYD